MVPVKAPEVQQAVKRADPRSSRTRIGGNVSISSLVLKNTEAVRPVSSVGGGKAQGSVRGAHSGHVTWVAKEVGVQREALRAGFIGQLLAALLERDVETRLGGAGRELGSANEESPPTSQW